MAAQMNYSFDTPKGVAGGKVDLAYDEVVTRQNEEADGVLKFGMAAAVGTSAGSTVKVPAAGTTKAQIEGVVLHAANTEQDMSGKVILKKDVSVGIMRKGHVWGRLAADAVTTYAQTAYVVTSGKDAGAFTHLETQTGDDGAANLDIGAKFGNVSDTDNGIAVIELG